MEDMSGNFRIIATISKGIAAFYALMSLSFISHVLVAYKVLKYVLRKCRAYQPGLTATGNMGKKFSSHSYVYILALTTVDAIVVGHLPLIALDILLQRWPFGPTMCKFYWAAECLNKQLSTLIMAAFSFDRYLAVCRPNERKLRSVKMATVVVSLCVILASLLILPVVSNAELRDMAGDDVGRSPNFSENSNNKSILKCSLNWSSENEFIYTCVLFVISYCFPLVLMIFFYGKIVLVIKRHGKRAAIIKAFYKKQIMGWNKSCSDNQKNKNAKFHRNNRESDVEEIAPCLSALDFDRTTDTHSVYY
uniref:G-protein coupled receptors family 1 profile domain-containing protein n=1 Tax=Romanomermis culicivorax TaxID=13658 RepID=A0A915IRL7_ROMCU